VNLSVRLYSKPGCHLCEDARALLEDLASEFNLVIEEIDITRDDALLSRYRHDIPVLLLGDREIGRGRITEGELVLALKKAARIAKGNP
jgi:glutaredoxin